MNSNFVNKLSTIIILALCLCSCDSGKSNKESQPTVKPLNLSVYLDLSDRLARDLVPSQTSRDSLIIDKLIDIFIDDCVKNGRIIGSKNHFQIFFHPAPKNSEIATLSSGLNLDLSNTDIKEKKTKLKEMKDVFSNNVSQIYNSTMTDKDWLGSDIWAFFSDKKVDNQCIREGYRNILVILTDGYLFYQPNKRQEGKAYSYVLPQTLKDPQSSLIVKRDGLEDLEVLLLEVNPYQPVERDRLINVLENWFSAMGVSRFVVADTDMPVNIANIISNFMR